MIIQISDDAVVKECGVIKVSSYKLNAKDQTYKFECGKDGKYPVGNKLRVRLEDTNKPLEIAEISAFGEKVVGGPGK